MEVLEEGGVVLGVEGGNKCSGIFCGVEAGGVPFFEGLFSGRWRRAKFDAEFYFSGKRREGFEYFTVVGAACHLITGHEKGHIHADFRSELHEFFVGEFELFKVVEGEQEGGRIAAGTAEAGAGRNAFFERDAVFENAAGVGLENVQGFHDGVAFGGKGFAVKGKFIGAFERERVLKKPRAHKNRVEEVVARFALAKDGEE